MTPNKILLFCPHCNYKFPELIGIGMEIAIPETAPGLCSNCRNIVIVVLTSGNEHARIPSDSELAEFKETFTYKEVIAPMIERLKKQQLASLN